MTEQQTEATEPAQDEAKAEGQSTEAVDNTDWKAEARKWEQRAKDNKGKASDFDRQLKERMSESEKAVAEAEQRGRTAAVQQYGNRLARTEFDALAARRNPDFKTNDVLEYVDLSRMIGEDGEPDTKALRAAVERLVPAPQGEIAPDFTGGSRQPPSPVKSFGDELRNQLRRG